MTYAPEKVFCLELKSKLVMLKTIYKNHRGIK